MIDVRVTAKLAQKGWLLADGATGTNIFNMGLGAGEPPEAWNLTRPADVTRLYQNAIEAGADLFLTNSFGANRTKLSLSGHEDKRADINRAAATLARDAAERAGLWAMSRPVVAGSIGPTGDIIQPMGRLSFAAAVEIFHEQAEALREGGADILWLETFAAREEYLAAAEAARLVDMPWAGTMSFDTLGHTMMGVLPKDMQKMHRGLKHPPLAFGANCGLGLGDLVKSVQDLATAALATESDPVLIAKGNAGVARYYEGHIHYDGTPQMMARYAILARAAGARIIGGCCGTMPEHLRAMREALESQPLGLPPSPQEILDQLGGGGFVSPEGGGAKGLGRGRRPRRG